MKELDRVTLVCVDCKNHGEAVVAIKKSLEQIKPARTVFITDINIEIEGVDTVIIPKIKSQREYSNFIFKSLFYQLNTEYALIVQHDGWVLNGECWNEEFYEYDYIGAPWLYTDGRNVGNGGFCLYSKKLLRWLALDNFISVCSPDDECVGRLYRGYLEQKYDIKFPSEKIADKFSYELRQPNQPTFGFHSFFWPPFKETVVIKRSAAMGDVVMAEPVLDYFHNKGYRVVLDTLPQFEQLFMSHHYPVELKRNFDHKRIPYTEYNLDMSYESKPKQLHLQSYYEFCGIKDGEIKNPVLSFPKDRPKIFDKYIILHYDERPQASRNIHGLNWDKIVAYFTEIGYIVIQLGVADFKIKGAIPIKTPDIYFLKWVVSGASYFIGCDSGISHIASGFNIPSIIFFGSVDPNVIHPDLSNKMIITNTDVCEKPFCWGDTIGCSGTPCYIDDQKPPCVSFEDESIITAIKEFVV